MVKSIWLLNYMWEEVNVLPPDVNEKFLKTYFRSIFKILHAKFGFKLKELYYELMPLTHVFIIGGLK